MEQHYLKQRLLLMMNLFQVLQVLMFHYSLQLELQQRVQLKMSFLVSHYLVRDQHLEHGFLIDFLQQLMQIQLVMT